MKKYIIALDQGTTSSRAIIFDKEQNIIEIAQSEFAQLYPQKGYVEHDPMEIYASQYGVLVESLAKSGISVEEISAIGITNQRETTILWDKNTGRPVYNAIVWQCRRTSDYCREIEKDDFANYIKENTGLVVDAYFSATKVKWILDNVKGVREKAENGDILFGTVDSWLVWKLTGGKVHATDYTNASRTMMFNIKNLCWDENILNYFNIPKSILPQVKFSDSVFGYANIEGENIPIAGVAGDQQAALFGQKCFEKGDAKNTYGTGCFLLM
ncbi:MAG: FGGY family carbohydrate kinase, partial [Clostridia bacterium]